jgi:hypothetical protein
MPSSTPFGTNAANRTERTREQKAGAPAATTTGVRHRFLSVELPPMLVASWAISSRHEFGERTFRYPDMAAEPDHPNAPLAYAPFDKPDRHIELLGGFSFRV